MRAFKLKIDSSGDVISLVTRAGTVLYASPSTARVFGYCPEEIVGRNAFDLVHPQDQNHLRRATSAVLAGSCTRRLKIRARRKDGEWLCVESTIYKLPDEYRFGTIFVNCRELIARTDVSERGDRAIDELFASNSRLEYFAYAVAHDLREPLRTISIFTELLLKETRLDAEGELVAQFIANGVTRMSQLFEGLHSFAMHSLAMHSFAMDGLDRSSQLLDLRSVVDAGSEACHNDQ